MYVHCAIHHNAQEVRTLITEQHAQLSSLTDTVVNIYKISCKITCIINMVITCIITMVYMLNYYGTVINYNYEFLKCSHHSHRYLR